MNVRQVLTQDSQHGGMQPYKAKVRVKKPKKQTGGSVSTGNGGYSGGIS